VAAAWCGTSAPAWPVHHAAPWTVRSVYQEVAERLGFVHRRRPRDSSAIPFYHWHRCEFQGIGTLDQVVFLLLGGRIDRLGGNCKLWNTGPHCQCSAPVDLLGRNHTVVEIGANDGIHMSNSRFFEKFLGWRSLCIEANPHLFRLLQSNRPRCTNVNALIAERDDFADADAVPYISFYQASTPDAIARGHYADWHQNARWRTGVSGIESANASNHEIRSFARARAFAKKFDLQVERTLLQVQPFSILFRRHTIQSIDVLSVDVEGAEYSVLRSIDFAAVKIRMVVVERPSEATRGLLVSKGFLDLDLQSGLGDRFYHNSRWFVSRR